MPLLDLLEQNPDFALTFELQGYMVDVLAERHAIKALGLGSDNESNGS